MGVPEVRQETKEKEVRKSFEEILYEKLYQTFQAVGVAINIPQMEALRSKAKELSFVISKEATVRAVDLLTEVKAILLTKMISYEDKLSTIEKQVDNLIKKTDNLKEEDGK